MKKRFFYLLLGLVLSATSLFAAETITVGELFYDTGGNLIQAHGGCIFKYNGYYYWFGENRSGNNLVACYRSTNLKTWEFRNNVLTRSANSELSDANIERPKVIYCSQTGQFVMWAHKELSSDYSQARACIATCSTIDGNYSWVRSFRPLEHMSRDCTLFTDTDGRTYFVSAANENYDLHIYRLTADCLNIESLVYQFIGGHREAPALFKAGSTYFLVTSGATGWDPNQGQYCSATNLAGPWSGQSSFGNSTTYYSQPMYILPIQGSQKTSYLYLGDRWAGAWGGAVNDSQYVWLPITLNSSTSISITNTAVLTVDAATGVITNGEGLGTANNLAYNKTAAASSAESANPANAGCDGSYTTRWCAADGNTGAWWRVDLGAEYAVAEIGFYFEFAEAFQYLIEGSLNNSAWSTIVDQRSATSKQMQRTHAVNTRTRYVRITFTTLPNSRWASLFDFSVRGTASTATATATRTATPGPTTTLRKGDVNQDGSVSIVDALMTAQYAVGLNPAGFLQAAADVNNDGSITIVDALMIAQYSVGLITVFP